MTTEAELSKQSAPISKLEKYSCHWVLKVLVISRGPVITYKKPKQEGVFQNIILIDKEGTKIQTTLFNTFIEKWKDFLQPNKTYYIINGCLDAVNPNYSSVHKEVEIAFTENTIVKESAKSIPIERFSNRFISIDEAQILEDGSIFVPVSRVLINPDTRKASDLRYWRDSMKAETKEISLSTSTAIRKIKEVRLGDIVDGLFAYAQDSFYRFTATISELLNINKPWCCCCNKCFKKVDVIDDTSRCPNCKVENAGYKKRYCLRVQVTAARQSTTVVLFEAATSLVGCTVIEFIDSTLKKNEESKYYQKLVLSLDKKFAFVARIARKKPNSGSLIVERNHVHQKYCLQGGIRFNRQPITITPAKS